eukprot:TRINITY_DN10202_c0_g2_i1.p1 TRINITY_DN10202_c0_g2~~TRINITY_DN10202_c0_g2_i1.p1  ORF type:complete len:269 (+),score=39.09 TRINITY_DN10202_c0_g2_i1:39-845(+)
MFTWMQAPKHDDRLDRGCNFKEKEFECSIVSLKGDACTLTVQRTWSVARLKESIEDEMGIPCYLQVLSDANRKLRNIDVLYDVWSAQNFVGARLSLFVLCADIPEHFSRAEAQRVWEAFRISSADLGDTVNKTDLIYVFRFSGCSAYEFQLKALSVKSELLSFVDVLSLITEWKTRYYRANKPVHSAEARCVPDISYPCNLSDARFEAECAKYFQNLPHQRLKARSRSRMRTRLQEQCCALADEVVGAKMVTFPSIDCQARSCYKISL